jgi:putative MATE family efflux protein
MQQLSETIELTSKPGWWATLREAVRGSEQDFTEGSLRRAIFLLAVPMVLEMSMESLFVIFDIFWVGRLGAAAVATVGLTESLLSVVYTMAMGLSMGATAIVARRIGEKDTDGAARAAVQVIYIGLAVSFVLSVLGIAFGPRLLAVMGASPEVLQVGSSYVRVMLGGEVSVIMLFLLNAIFRGAGDAAVAMRVLWLANVFNIILGPCFIYGIGPFPELGVTGAAVGTTIGRSIGVMFAFSNFWREGGRITLRPEHWKFRPQLMARIARLSGSAVVQQFVGIASWIGLTRILAGFGDNAVAGYTIGIRWIIFVLLPSWGLCNAAATLVGQSLGAKNPERAEKAVWKACFYNAVILGGLGLLFILFARPLVSLFTNVPEVMDYSADCLRIVSYGFVLYGYGMVLAQSFNGAGDTWTPTYLNLITFWVLELPLAYLLAHAFGYGPRGVFWAITIAFSFYAVAGGLIFRRGRWKKVRV